MELASFWADSMASSEGMDRVRGDDGKSIGFQEALRFRAERELPSYSGKSCVLVYLGFESGYHFQSVQQKNCEKNRKL
jgi:hypothetical protein